ncbi:MAG: phosphoserine phosphatase SerB [Paracoccus sp. (in: a-proteobacteria)]|uniref:phosphoserine phosphatase SerB n=1 Tax=Paracoccus sp. TaxID=267 RepID=UPI0026E06DB3|nr:phosphoserine phosphatase SerB [Paracoccus sp. (in: a-proteobacteria)]MDO5622856.1 phosphoserine phosphatase SerB [Paracoccus sp. (in: a-proteobacteria)]
MFTVSLLAAPTRADLTPDHVETLVRAWDGGHVIWLNPGVAAEFPVQVQPGDFWTRWADMQKLGFDLCIQPTEGRVKSILIADMDSTMILQECIDELADHAGVGDRVAAITARAMNGELDFESALNERVGLLAGLPVSTIAEVLETRITLAPGAHKLVATMRAQGAYTALVSGGFTDFTSVIAASLGFDEHRANTLLSDGEVLTGKVGLPILGRDAKVTALNEIATRLGVTPADAIAVGDGANDLGMLQLAGTGVALHAKPVVAEQAQFRINHGDLTALLYLQGYGEDEFSRD